MSNISSITINGNKYPISAITKTLLWKNASLSSMFPMQTVAIDFTSYDELEVEFLTYGKLTGSWGDNRTKVTIPIEMGVLKTNYAGGVAYANANNNTTINAVYCRSFIPKAGEGLYFSDSLRVNTLAADNNYLTPCKIYGIKGVA